ncbi:MAG: hypothetical protein HRU06_16365 [Oceanospirillaceae bacterium]|nr:hypothetical protein [Oceanospirillaceae bacterium]
MLKNIIILFTSLLIISGCSSSNEQESVKKQAPVAAPIESMEAMDSSVFSVEDDLNTQKELLNKSKRAPSILIIVEDDDMPRLD